MNIVCNVEDLVEKCFLIDGNKDYLCVARIPNLVEGD